MPRQKRRSQRERSTESGRRLLASAVELIAEQGFERTSIAEIGRRSGYSHSIVSARYGTKEALLESLWETEFEARLLQPTQEGGNGLARLLSTVDLAIQQLEQDPALLRAFFMLIFEIAGPVTGMRLRLIDWLSRYELTIAQAMSAGLRDGSIQHVSDPDRAAREMVAFFIGRAFRWILEPQAVDYVSELRDWRESFATANRDTQHAHD